MDLLAVAGSWFPDSQILRFPDSPTPRVFTRLDTGNYINPPPQDLFLRVVMRVRV